MVNIEHSRITIEAFGNKVFADSEAATINKLKKKPSNMRTGQSFENRELVPLADLSN